VLPTACAPHARWARHSGVPPRRLACAAAGAQRPLARLAPGHPAAGCPECNAWQQARALSTGGGEALAWHAARKPAWPRGTQLPTTRRRLASRPQRVSPAKPRTLGSPRMGGLGTGGSSWRASGRWAPAAQTGRWGRYRGMAPPARMRRAGRWLHISIVIECACTCCVHRRRVTAAGALVQRALVQQLRSGQTRW
jgi:hypothetical protein